jgi:hypothetical protein
LVDADDSDDNLFDDYELRLKHEVFDPIPENLKKKIRDFVVIEFWPAVFEYLGIFLPQYRNFPTYLAEIEGLILPSYEDGITRELAYDLHKAEPL